MRSSQQFVIQCKGLYPAAVIIAASSQAPPQVSRALAGDVGRTFGRRSSVSGSYISGFSGRNAEFIAQSQSGIFQFPFCGTPAEQRRVLH